MSAYTSFVEVTTDKGLVGVLGVEIDGFTRIHTGWLKEMLEKAGYGYEEVEL